MQNLRTDRLSKGSCIFDILNDYVVIDIETTGLDPSYDDIIEMAAVRIVGGKVSDVFSSLVNPGYEIPDFITKLTGITNDMLLCAPALDSVLRSFLSFVNTSVIIGHNVNFDVNFIYDSCASLCFPMFQNNFIDIMRLSRRLFPDLPHHRLNDMVAHFNISEKVDHRALSDVRCAHQCYEHIKSYIASNDIPASFFSHTHKSRGVKARDIFSSSSDFDFDGPIYGNTFVFTGALNCMLRKDAMQAVVDRGGFIGDSVTKVTNYLVLGDGAYFCALADGKSSKHKKAEKMKLDGFPIDVISERVFIDML